MSRPWQAAVLGIAVVVGGCDKGDKASSDDMTLLVGKDSVGLSKYLPPDGVDGYSKGPVEGAGSSVIRCKLMKGDKEVAVLKLTDFSENSSMHLNSSLLERLMDSSEKVGGHPWVHWTGGESVMLVNRKYGISVNSEVLDMAAQRALMAKFDLEGLAKL